MKLKIFSKNIIFLAMAVFSILIYGYLEQMSGADKNKEKSNDEKQHMVSSDGTKDKIFTEAELDCTDCNIVIISATSLRKDHMSLYGYQRNTTPNIDEFAKNALVFENAFAPSPWTLPNGISLFTSLFPYEHNVMSRSEQLSQEKKEGVVNQKLDEKVVNLIDILKQNGYKTAAFTGGFDYDEKWGLTDRFDDKYIVDYKKEGGFGKFSSSVPKAIDWIEKNKNGKFMIFVQGYDEHCPYDPQAPYDKLFVDQSYDNKNLNRDACYVNFELTPPVMRDEKKYYKAQETYAVAPSTDSQSELSGHEIELSEGDIRNLKNLYDGGIRQADEEIQKLIQAIENDGLRGKTMIIFISEHGELFGERGKLMRGGQINGTFYDEVLNIPMIIKYPNLNEGKKIDGLVQLVDIMPTVLDSLKIRAEYKFNGKSMLPLIEHNSEINKFVFAGLVQQQSFPQTIFGKDIKISALRNKEWKLISTNVTENGERTVSVELYNIKKDPGEFNDLFLERGDIYAILAKDLNGWESQFGLGE